MNCPSCGAPIDLQPDSDSFRCDYCHSVYFPEKDDDGVRVLGEPTSDLCPHCDQPLVHAAIAKIRIRYCTRCHGMLIPMAIMETLIEELRATGTGTAEQPAADKGDLRRRLKCPHCHTPMDAHYYAGPGNVVMDSCEKCSLDWLDRGRLMRIARAPDGAPPEAVFETALGDDDTTGSARCN